MNLLKNNKLYETKKMKILKKYILSCFLFCIFVAYLNNLLMAIWQYGKNS